MGNKDFGEAGLSFLLLLPLPFFSLVVVVVVDDVVVVLVLRPLVLGAPTFSIRR
jgi:hypothetical protein